MIGFRDDGPGPAPLWSRRTLSRTTASSLASRRTSGALFPVAIDFNRRIHENFSSN
jgi:hypothetical protein